MNTQFKTAVVVGLVLGLNGLIPNAVADDIFKLQHRSSFKPPERNPFWPIGWVKSDAPQQAVAVQQERQVSIGPDSFVVTGISISDSPLAMINGKPYGEGETIVATYGGQKIKIVVLAIEDGAVTMGYQGKKFVVPVKRPELQHKESKELDPRESNVMILR